MMVETVIVIGMALPLIVFLLTKIINFSSIIDILSQNVLSIMAVSGIVAFVILSFFIIINMKYSEENETSNDESERMNKILENVNKDNYGYMAAIYLAKSADMIHSVIYKGRLEYNKELLEQIKKIDKILDIYIADSEYFKVSMYRYEETFEIMNETINKYLISNEENKANLVESINNLLTIPSNEIIFEKGDKWLYGKSKNEHQVIKDMENNKSFNL